MKITICNSVHFWEKAKQAQESLKRLGHEALTHPMEVELDGRMIPVIEYYKARKAMWNESIEDLKEWAMREHFSKIKASDAILVLNVDKDGKKNYIGGNTLLEMGLAFALEKKIFMLNPVPEELSYAEEIKGMKPLIIGDDFSRIR
jgi:nucleoside 2-deoxyribosyltransferase